MILSSRFPGRRGNAAYGVPLAAYVFLAVLLLGLGLGDRASAQDRTALNPRQLTDRYVGILEALAQGQDPRSAAEAMSELVVQAYAQPGLRRQWAGLQRGWIRALESRCGRECLVPMWFLLQDLSRDLAHKQQLDAARRVLGALEDLEKDFVAGLRKDSADPNRQLAARMLTRMALDLRQDRRLEEALVLLERALEHDRYQAVALRAAAAVEEKQAHYRIAAGYLDRLIELEPDDTRARLRRALCQLRSGPESRGLRALEELSDPASGAPAWVRTVAFQERTRQALVEGRREEAQQWLSSARRSHPDDQALVVLASALSPQPSAQGRQHAEALAAGAGFATDLLPSAGPSARFVYNHWPTTGLEGFYLTLEEDLEAHRGALLKRLGSMAAARAAR